MSTTAQVPETRPALTGRQWLVCGTAATAFAFAIYMYLMLPLIVGPAAGELLGAKPGSALLNEWVGRMFYIPAICGGIFGLLGGYFIDLFGRKTVMVASILLFGLSAFASGFVTSMPVLLMLRCGIFVGVSVQFVAAVTWMAELFPDPKQREAVVGYTQVAQSMGGTAVAAVYGLMVTFAAQLPLINGGHEAWRYTMMTGLLPAVLIVCVMPFLPESPVWQQKKRAGTLKRPNVAELFQPAFRKTTIVATIMMACAFGVASGAIQQMPRIVPGLPELARMSRTVQQQNVSAVQLFQEIGGLLGRFLLAFLAVRIASRRTLLRIFQVPGLFIVPCVFLIAATGSVTFARWGIFIVAFTSVSQLSFWGNYLPRVYPTHLRGTGEGFAANVGGRMLGNTMAGITTGLVASMPGNPAAQLAYAAAIVAGGCYLVGVTASFFLPEPQQQALPE